MLVPIVMLMLLTLPAFEAIVDFRSRRATMMVGALVGFGFLIQLIGAAVYETVNEWYRKSVGMEDNGKFAFVPSASPVIMPLRSVSSDFAPAKNQTPTISINAAFAC
jgi:hypothetical protein